MRDLIEAMARAIEKSLAWDVESDVRASELTREEHRQVATAVLAKQRETHHLAPRTDGDDGELVDWLNVRAAILHASAAWGCDEDGAAMHQAADRITALSAEVERLRGLFAGLAIDADACAVARQYARAALGAKP
jgi:hypothetical protein